MKKLTGVIGAFLLATCAPLAHADFQLSYQLGGGVATICGTNTVTASPNAADLCAFPAISLGSGVSIFNFSGTGSQTAANSEQFGSTAEIKNTGATTQTLTLWLADQNFTSPTTPPSILYTSNLSLTATAGSGSVSMVSCVDTSNLLAPPTNPFCSAPAATLSNGPEAYGTSNHDTTTTLISSLAGTYTLSQKVTLTLNAGSDLNISTSQVLASVPEPASLLLLGSVLLGASLLFRRKVPSKRA